MCVCVYMYIISRLKLIILSFNKWNILYVYMLDNRDNPEELVSHHSFERNLSFPFAETVILQHLELACVMCSHILSLHPSNFILISTAAIHIARLL